MIRPEFICLTTEWGGRDTTRLSEGIPGLRFCVDTEHDAMKNFLASLRMTSGPSVHLEDDVELCDKFYDKVVFAVNRFPDRVISFFSTKPSDYDHDGPFERPGRLYLMNQCFYLPAGLGRAIADYYETWPGKAKNPTGMDSIIADYLAAHKMGYVQWMPHLVNHQETRSLIDPRRSSKRTDKHFTK